MSTQGHGHCQESDENYADRNSILNTVNNLEVEESSWHKYLLISYTGVTASAYPQRKSDMDMFGLYHKTEEMRDGRSVYIQEHDEQYGGSPCKLFRDQGVWWIKYRGDLRLRTATHSESSPTSVKWQYEDYDGKWHDLELIVTSLSEKPSECEITINLSQDVARIIKEPGVAGVYRALSSYCRVQGKASTAAHGGLLHTLCGLRLLESEC